VVERTIRQIHYGHSFNQIVQNYSVNNDYSNENNELILNAADRTCKIYVLRLKLRNLKSILYVCKHVFETAIPSGAEANPIHRAHMKNKIALSIALAATLTLSFIPDIYASGPDNRFNDIPGAVF
jgi:hypothetical protein